MLCVFMTVSLSAQTTQPMVAIHVSELTEALATTPASAPTPTGAGTTGYEWWTPYWQPFVMSEALKEALRSDGTPFVVVTDADIAAGKLLTATGAPAYPIVISLANEAIGDGEVAPLLSYVNAGGYLFIGGSSFTRNPDGTTRGDFALANQMGLHMTVPNLQNWYPNTTFTNSSSSNPLTSHIPVGTAAWQMPLTSEDISWGTSPHPGSQAEIETYHYIWQVTPGNATVIATGDGTLPYITTTPYGQGQFIYDAAMQPLMGFGGFSPGMYAYGIFRNAIQWAFQSANIPLAKVSPWPYQYNAAYMVRHDLEDYQSDISEIESSAQFENSLGALGEYYFCTGTLRVEMGNSPSVIAGLQQAATLYGATIGSHNGGLPDPNNSSLVLSDFDYWHWGPDEALDDTIPGYSSGSAYASASLTQSFTDISSWMSGYEPNLKTWVAPYFNATREGSSQVLKELGAATAGEQKLGPFPHWTLSTQTDGLRYSFLTLPLSDWILPAGACGAEYCIACDQSNCVSQSIDYYDTTNVDAVIDYYYSIGALINIYMHELSSDSIPAEYIQHSASKAAIWPVNAATLLGWWTNRSPVQITPSYAVAGTQVTLTATVSGATDSGTAVEFVIPNWAATSGSLQVLLDGTPASPSSYRTYGNGIKVSVGATVSTVQVSYTFSSAQTIAVGTPAPSSAAFNSQFTVAATASSGLPVAYTSSGGCTNSGATYTMTSASTACSVIFNQAGDTSYAAAPEVTEMVTATAASQTITVGTAAPSSAAYNSQFTVAATASSGLPVAYSAAGGCTNSGANFTMTSGTIACTVNFDQAGDGNYAAAPEVAETVTATLADQAALTVTGVPATAAFETNFTVASAGGSGTGAVTFLATGSCSNTGATVSMTSGTGTCSVTATKAADTNYSSTTSVAATASATLADQAALTVTGVPATAAFGTNFTVASAGGSGTGAVTFLATGSCSNTGTTVSMTSGSGTCSVTATKAADSNYSSTTSVAATASATLASQATLTVTGVPATAAFGTNFTVASAGGTGTGAVTFAATGACSNAGRHGEL